MTRRTTATRRGFLGRLGSALGGLIAAPAGLGLAGAGRSARADDTTLWRQLYMLRARGYGVNGVPLPGFVWTSSLQRKLRHDTTFRRQFYATFGAPGGQPVYAAPAQAPVYVDSNGATYSYSYGPSGYPTPSGYAAPGGYGTPAYGYPPQGYAAPGYGNGYAAPAYSAPAYPNGYAAPAYGAPTYPNGYAAPAYSAPAPPAPGSVPAPTLRPAPAAAPGVELPPPPPRPYAGPTSWRGRMADVLGLLES